MARSKEVAVVGWWRILVSTIHFCPILTGLINICVLFSQGRSNVSYFHFLPACVGVLSRAFMSRWAPPSWKAILDEYGPLEANVICVLFYLISVHMCPICKTAQARSCPKTLLLVCPELNRLHLIASVLRLATSDSFLAEIGCWWVLSHTDSRNLGAYPGESTLIARPISA